MLINIKSSALELQLKGRKNQGLHALRLSDHAVRLKGEKIYEWSACVLSEVAATYCSPKDYLTVGYIERKLPAPVLMAKIAEAEPLKQAWIFAQQGLWYDALGLLMDNREGAAHQPLLEARKQLLKQVGYSTTD